MLYVVSWIKVEFIRDLLQFYFNWNVWWRALLFITPDSYYASAVIAVHCGSEIDFKPLGRWKWDTNYAVGFSFNGW